MWKSSTIVATISQIRAPALARTVDDSRVAPSRRVVGTTRSGSGSDLLFLLLGDALALGPDAAGSSRSSTASSYRK